VARCDGKFGRARCRRTTSVTHDRLAVLSSRLQFIDRTRAHAPSTMVSSFRIHCCVSVAALLLLTMLSSSPSSSSSPGCGLLRVAAIGKKLTEKQLGAIEDQWMEDEVEEEGQRAMRANTRRPGQRATRGCDAGSVSMRSRHGG
jgi:hypothetical protein